MLDGHAIIQACKTASALVRFVTAGGLHETILALSADVHAESAALALSNVGRSADPRAAVWIAVGHLQSAHVAHRKVWEPHFTTALGGLNRQVACTNANYNDIEVCWVMALCHIFLGEKAYAFQAMRFADEAIDAERNQGIKVAFAAYFSALTSLTIRPAFRKYPNLQIGVEIGSAIYRMPEGLPRGGEWV